MLTSKSSLSYVLCCNLVNFSRRMESKVSFKIKILWAIRWQWKVPLYVLENPRKWQKQSGPSNMGHPVWLYNYCRSQCVSILSRLNWLDRKQFRIFMKDLIDNKSVQFLLSFFHSYLGFCSEMTNPFSPNPNVVQLSALTTIWLHHDH